MRHRECLTPVSMRCFPYEAILRCPYFRGYEIQAGDVDFLEMLERAVDESDAQKQKQKQKRDQKCAGDAQSQKPMQDLGHNCVETWDQRRYQIRV